MEPAAFAAIGECMIELSGAGKSGGAGGGDDLWRMGVAGDTLNTTWYARAVLPPEHGTAYVTALGQDDFSGRLRGTIEKAGIAADRIRTVPDRRPGLYAITLDGAERHFTYWRGESAAKLLADDPDWLRQALAGVDTLYFSGITLAILSERGRDTLLSLLRRRREEGARVAFDPNYRPSLWTGVDTARAVITEAYGVCSMVSPTFDDEQKLFGDARIEETAERIARTGAEEIVVKNGPDPCLLVSGGVSQHIAAEKPERIVDTTGAGDSFAGAYLAARIMGREPAEAARVGHRTAARVIGAYGALTAIDREEVLA
ncbi:2-keto-3-deoxygluconate kinase [Faunimonas pinastri]|uniref:2-keto-3-deoxygluconate kinase n=1 Tax=Faunimonas pinastri TaxID=1855383 RepID=A0A1H9NZT0_9HYPH|nr:sugar kinase [Faunimonas pinastri]SER41327.1 2-keto-3-deoxygluconate kinase [Faunimonas pinastri]